MYVCIHVYMCVVVRLVGACMHMSTAGRWENGVEHGK